MAALLVWRFVLNLGLSAGFGMFTSVLTKIIGGQVLQDVQTFVASVDTLFGGAEGEASDQCHFAGEHCSGDFQGYMEGGAREGEAGGPAGSAEERVTPGVGLLY